MEVGSKLSLSSRMGASLRRWEAGQKEGGPPKEERVSKKEERRAVIGGRDKKTIFGRGQKTIDRWLDGQKFF